MLQDVIDKEKNRIEPAAVGVVSEYVHAVHHFLEPRKDLIRLLPRLKISRCEALRDQ